MKRLETRHWTFIGLFVVVTAAMLIHIPVKLRISPNTQKMFDYIDSLPAGSVLIISFDHEASSLPEIRPLSVAILRHAFKKDLKLIGVSLLSEGTLIGYRMMQSTADEYGRKYGTDYVYLGFRPQYIAAILSMGESIEQTYPQDYLGQPYGSFPLTKMIRNYGDVAAVISIADGNFTTHWIEYGAARYNVRVLAAVTAAMVTSYDPYLASGQLYSMVGGLIGAAEYEKLLGIGGGGARGMLAQTSSHMYVILLIVIGNGVYFTTRSKKGGR